MAPPAIKPPATLPADFNGWDQAPPKTLPADFDKWDKPTAPASAMTAAEQPKSFLKGVQDSFDANTRTSPKEPLLETGLKSVVGAIGAPLVHPINTAKGILDMVPGSPDLPNTPMKSNGTTYLRDEGTNPIVNRGVQAYHDVRDGGPGYAATKLGGELFGGLALGEGTGAAVRGMGAAADTVRNVAVGDPNAAALRGLRIGPRSPKAISTLSAIEGARPFLKGATSLEDLQGRIPAAKNEIWSPYKQAIDTVGDKSTGFGTVADLENERLQNSALLRGLKSKNPEAIQLAMQKGLNEADLLAQEKQLKSILDPELRATGIDPTAIRKSFGEVSRIGKQVSGRSTLIEAEKPYGIGKMLDLDLHKPLQAPGKIMEGLRDVIAGRPLLRGKPTDVSILEGFRDAGPKPDFGRILTPQELANPFLNKSKVLSKK